jgi:uncharacterized protein YdeI (YjbR/CyaY-like superfamily)
MASRDPRVTAYIASAAPFARPIFKHLRPLVHAACPGVQEDVKWRHPAFMYKGILGGFAGFKAYCAFMFWNEGLLKSRLSPADVDALQQLQRMTSIDDLPPDRAITRLIKAAVALQDAGITRTPRPRPAKDRTIEAPPYLLEALDANEKAKAAFAGFSYSHKKEYIEWLTEAKTESTRMRRLETAVAWMAEGKSRNWKYV